MPPEISILAEILRQIPAMGAALFVGWVVFRAYQGLVTNMTSLIASATMASTAATAAIASATESIEELARAVQRFNDDDRVRHERLEGVMRSVPTAVAREILIERVRRQRAVTYPPPAEQETE